MFAILGEVQFRTGRILNLPLMITVLFWGLNFVALKVAYVQMSAPAVGLVRYLAMYVFLLAVCFIRRDSLKAPLNDFIKLSFLGMLTMGVYMVFFLEGMRNTSPVEGAIILASAPIFTFLLSLLVKHERFNGVALMGSGVAFCGVLFVILSGAELSFASGHLQANLLMLAAAMTWSCCVVITRGMTARYTPLQVLTISMPGGLLVLIPYGLSAALDVQWTDLTWSTWVAFMHVSLLSGGVAFLCFYQGVRRIGSSAAMNYQYFVPPIAAVAGFVILRASIQVWDFLGLIIVTVGVIIATKAREKAMRQEALQKAIAEIPETATSKVE